MRLRFVTQGDKKILQYREPIMNRRALGPWQDVPLLTDPCIHRLDVNYDNDGHCGYVCVICDKTFDTDETKVVPR